MTIHPLGYTKINLGGVGGYRARLHIWHGHGSEKPHDHRWTFLAIPLLGAFTDTRWTPTTGNRYRRADTTPPSAGHDRTYKPAGTGDLIALSHTTRRPLRPYRCRLGEIHSYAPTGRGPHVSLVLLGRPTRPTSTVWRPIP